MKKIHIKIIASIVCLCTFALTSCNLGMFPEDTEILDVSVAPAPVITEKENETKENDDGKKNKDNDKNTNKVENDKSSNGSLELPDQAKTEIKQELLDELLKELEKQLGNEELTPSTADLGYVIVTDYLKANTGKDLTDDIQKIIDENPNKVIYFPDGVYMISKPIQTSAVPQESVSLLLSNYAVIKATDNWSGAAMIRLGGAKAANDVKSNGSNYYLKGGIVDGSGKANGVSIASGRLTTVSDVAIKNTRIGFTLERGANGGSADASIKDISIIGNNELGSVGIVVQGCDNIFSNIYIQNVLTGVQLNAGGNVLRNIHVIGANSDHYETSIAFNDYSGMNWYDNCYSDQYAVGFQMGNGLSNYTNCFCYWYRSDVSNMVGFKTSGKFNSVITNCRVNFNSSTEANCEYIQVGTAGGSGRIETPIFDERMDTVKNYQDYIVGDVMWTK